MKKIFDIASGNVFDIDQFYCIQLTFPSVFNIFDIANGNIRLLVNRLCLGNARRCQLSYKIFDILV